MKKLTSILLIWIILISECFSVYGENISGHILNIQTQESSEMNDSAFQQSLENELYLDLIDGFGKNEYFIENIDVAYVSQEYIEELSYNSKLNIYFGYTLSELEEKFSDQKYIFSYDDEIQETVVTEYEEYDGTYEQVLENVASGAGVILVCVTISSVTGGVAPAVSMIFAVSAKSAISTALWSGALTSITTGVVEGIETKNLEKTIKAAALAGSDSFKWGAIGGALTGGIAETCSLKGLTTHGLTLNEAAIIQKEMKYPPDVIKSISSLDEYQVYKESALTCEIINKKPALVQQIDLNYESIYRDRIITNLERMKIGLPPIDPVSQKAYELHHIGQKVDSPLAVLKQSQHRSADVYSILHDTKVPSVHAQESTAQWQAQTREFWKAFYELLK